MRMEYAPIDYSDLLLSNGVYFLNPKLPSVIGGEGAGIVEAIGPGVTSVKVARSLSQHSPGLKKFLLQPEVFSSFLVQSMPRPPRS